ncbi:predicted protein [Sclerotinia sclerotiorum 1980 UF-70]|uniref:Uncharacterized protein n=1 Tax=Sclerotinia sclerotiorum (strain ATCC 18683 / 1980 / Ss-1) TaxID=665079 RepID=A7E9B7_SCLS1|nr:predicted protein [Sclerotinia sclerotiorum 1980 UF-70]EDN96969.1 predicted protein [Sclerotinia sclerotiorum 1980 UF-70]
MALEYLEISLGTQDFFGAELFVYCDNETSNSKFQRKAGQASHWIIGSWMLSRGADLCGHMSFSDRGFNA